MLDRKEAEELIAKAKEGDEQAKTRLVEENSPLIKSVIRRYKNKGVEYDDLYQLGCIGFLKAIRNFSADFGVKFSTYAVPMIAGRSSGFSATTATSRCPVRPKRWLSKFPVSSNNTKTSTARLPPSKS